MTIDAVWNGMRYTCTVAAEEAPDVWGFPVGEQAYPPERWYCATFHGPNSRYTSGFHTGLDLNLDVAPWGDIERILGLSTWSIARGIVEWTGIWSGTGTAVIRHEHEGAPLWVRYAHIIPSVKVGDAVIAGTKLGPFDNWSPTDPKQGDHLHFDMALDRFTREWCSANIRWIDPVPVLKAHLDASRVDAMLARG